MKKRHNILRPKNGIKIKYLDSLIHNTLFNSRDDLKRWVKKNINSEKTTKRNLKWFWKIACETLEENAKNKAKVFAMSRSLLIL